MCAECVGGKGRKFLEKGRCEQEGQYLLNSPALQDASAAAGRTQDSPTPTPCNHGSMHSLSPQLLLAGYQGHPCCKPLPTSLLPSGLEEACPLEGWQLRPQGSWSPSSLDLEERLTRDSSTQPPPRLLQGTGQVGFSREPPGSVDGPQDCRNWAEGRTVMSQDEAKGRTGRAGPGFSPAPAPPQILPSSSQNICVLSTYHRLANADTGLGDGLGGLVFKAFWKRGGMTPFPGLQRELVGDFKGLSERQDDLIG